MQTKTEGKPCAHCNKPRSEWPRDKWGMLDGPYLVPEVEEGGELSATSAGEAVCKPCYKKFWKKHG